MLVGYQFPQGHAIFEIKDEFHVFMYGRNMQNLMLKHYTLPEALIASRVPHKNYMQSIILHLFDAWQMEEREVHFYAPPEAVEKIRKREATLDVMPFDLISIEILEEV